jgi:hypothetical protein
MAGPAVGSTRSRLTPKRHGRCGHGYHAVFSAGPRNAGDVLFPRLILFRREPEWRACRR